MTVYHTWRIESFFANITVSKNQKQCYTLHKDAKKDAKTAGGNSKESTKKFELMERTPWEIL